MSSTISRKPKKSLSNIVWLLIEWHKRGDANVENIKSVHISKDGATNMALVEIRCKVPQHTMEDGTQAKIHTWKEGLNYSYIGVYDWLYMPDGQWMYPDFEGGFRLEEHEVVDDKGLESKVWIQRLRNDDSQSNVSIYDIEGVYGSKSLAMAARSTEVDERERYLGNRYTLNFYQIQK